MRESTTRFSLSQINLSKPSYLRSLLSFPSHRCTQSSSFITLSRPSLTSRRNIANQSAPVLWNNLPSDLRHVVHQVTPFPIIIIIIITYLHQTT